MTHNVLYQMISGSCPADAGFSGVRRSTDTFSFIVSTWCTQPRVCFDQVQSRSLLTHDSRRHFCMRAGASGEEGSMAIRSENNLPRAPG